MKKFKLTATVFAVLVTALINLSSCEKDEGKLPNIAFKTGAGYTSANATVAASDSVTVGIIASKSEGEDVLKKLNISKTIGTGTVTTYLNYDIPSAQEDNFSADYKLPAGGNAGEQVKWTFTVTNRDGLTNAVSFTVTVY